MRLEVELELQCKLFLNFLFYSGASALPASESSSLISGSVSDVCCISVDRRDLNTPFAVDSQPLKILVEVSLRVDCLSRSASNGSSGSLEDSRFELSESDDSVCFSRRTATFSFERASMLDAASARTDCNQPRIIEAAAGDTAERFGGELSLESWADDSPESSERFVDSCCNFLRDSLACNNQVCIIILEDVLI